MCEPALVTQELVRQLYDYDPETGHFTRKTPHSRFPVGTRAGSTLSNGYRHIGIAGRRYYEHRLAWLYMTGEWPKDMIDHRDLDRSNNAWANLRAATNQHNMRNGSLRKDNKSGFKGVTWRPDQQRWRATIKFGGKQIHVGNFKAKEAAAAAYDAAALKYFGEFANPNNVPASNPPGGQNESQGSISGA